MAGPNPIAANVLGTTGAVCWSIQLLPQIWINYRRKHTTGLQPTMMLLWASAGIPLGAYNITRNFNVALLIQPQVLSVLSLVTWAQCLFYRDGSSGRRLSVSACVGAVTSMGAIMGAIEVGLVFALRHGLRAGIEWPTELMAILAAVLLAAGVARHYWDIYKERTVRGISFLFVGIDALGDLTSLISIFFQTRLDVLGMVIYGSELALWLGVFACGGWFNLRPWIASVKSQRSARAVTDARSSTGEAPVDLGEHLQEIASRSSSSSTVFRTASAGVRDDVVEMSRSDVVRQRQAF